MSGAMKAVLQRVSQAQVTVDGQVVGAIDQGFVILLGVEQGDSVKESSFLAQKITQLRIFSDQDGRMNNSITDVGGKILVISQFTLMADWKKGRRPGFSKAAAPKEANELYEHFCSELAGLGIGVEKGIFAAHMMVSLVNDGPVTLILEHKEEPVPLS